MNCVHRLINKLRILKRLSVKKYYKWRVKNLLQTEWRPCILCGNDKEFQLLSNKDRYGLPIETRKCLKCGLVFIQPMPTKEFLDLFYSTSMYRGLYKGFVKAGKAWLKVDVSIERAQIWADFVSENAKILGATVLDYGCSEGSFLKELKDRDRTLKAIGVEPGSSFSNFNKDTLDGLFESADDLQDEYFDVVTLWHVLEHLREPVEVLKVLRSKLKDGGILFLEVPNVDGYTYRGKEFHIGHLFHFGPATLRRVLEIAGFPDITIIEHKQVLRAIAKCYVAKNIYLSKIQDPHKVPVQQQDL